MKVLVIGGGASGMMAALTASDKHDVILLERQARVGRKLMATGNGRCNLTNRNVTPANYHGADAGFCRFALERFGMEDTLRFFEKLGLVCVTEPGGRVYPYSDSANSVVDVLRLTLEQSPRVRLVTGSEVVSLCRKKGRFLATTAEESYEGDCAIVCAGGMAGGKLGGTDLGYRLLGAFGHTRTSLFPALVQLKTDNTYVRSLKGIRCDVFAEMSCGDKKITGGGELQFTEYGVSGPVIFELSRFASTAGQPVYLFLDFLHSHTEGQLTELLQRRQAAMPGLKAEDLLTGILHNRLGRTILRRCGCSLETLCGNLPTETIKHIVQCVKRFELPVLGTMGLEHAQVTAGGIRTAEFCPDTLESRLCRGLYAAGEVLDVDGDCGGYNLQWAWSSGHLAGELRGMK